MSDSQTTCRWCAISPCVNYPTSDLRSPTSASLLGLGHKDNFVGTDALILTRDQFNEFRVCREALLTQLERLDLFFFISDLTLNLVPLLLQMFHALKLRRKNNDSPCDYNRKGNQQCGPRNNFNKCFHNKCQKEQ
jgi:hypothetical protein